MVTLPNDAGFCTGVIVSDHAVLTANHCLLTQGTYTIIGPDGNAYTTSDVVTFGTGSVSDTSDFGAMIFQQKIVQDATDIYSIGKSVNTGDIVTIVGFGCDNPQTRANGGYKRSGTNAVTVDSDFLTLMTPVNTVRIIGDSEEAGSCFGDSGGPMFDNNGKVVGLTHAGGEDSSGQNYISEYINLTNGTNHDLLANANQQYDLKISGL
jgi:V8-like Glu-specific endopeptidase